MASRNDHHADNGKRRFLRSVPNEKRARHDGQTNACHQNGAQTAMVPGAPADRHRGDDHREKQAKLVDLVREKKVTADAKA